MSKVGKKPVVLPEGVKAQILPGKLVISGPKGELAISIPNGFLVELQDSSLVVTNKSGKASTFGTLRANIANIIIGVSSEWSKTLEITGTGYRATTDSNSLTLSLGFSHPVVIAAPDGINFQVVQNKITVTGIDKMLVGRIAATIRRTRAADPYKGKGIHYEGEILRRKQGKAAKGAGGASQ